MSIWSGGLRLTGGRELMPDEREEIRRLSLRNRLHGSLLLVPLPFLFPLCVAALALPGEGGPPRDTLTMAVAGVMLLGTPWLLLAARDRLRDARVLAQDARSGRVDQFGAERPAGSAPETDWFEALPHSGLVWCVNGVRTSARKRAERSEAADPPPYAAIAAEWVAPLEEGREGSVYLNHRELSPAEREDLRRHLRRLVIPPVLLAAVLNAWLAIVLWAAGNTGHLPEGRNTLSFVFFVILVGAANWNLARCLPLGRKFLQDARTGRVVIARSSEDGEPVEGETAAPSLSPPEEFLPYSGVIWTRAGHPALWRLARR